MTGLGDTLRAHLQTGATTLCTCWALERLDGVVFGFTDHDVSLEFDGIVFKADSGMTAKALQQTTGLSVDNSEAVGALSDAAISEKDIAAGRYDDATLKTWLVNWADIGQRALLFCGSLGELQRSDGEFRAELRGLTDALNQPQGRIYQKDCTAILGDPHCGVDLDIFGYRTDRSVETVTEAQKFVFSDFSGFDSGWFERGRFSILSGAAKGLHGVIKTDRQTGPDRVIELWESIRGEVTSGDLVRLEAGCDKRHGTCRLKFNNLTNFRGFPHIPGEDWLSSFPANATLKDGRSLFGG